MTDNEIIKALECCNSNDVGSCNDCPLVLNNEDLENCEKRVRRETIDLINRQKAEIEKLNVELVGMRGACESYKMHYDNAQAEIERLKAKNQSLYKEIERIALKTVLRDRQAKEE